MVFDYETDGKSPETANITEISAVPIDLRNLNIISDEIFDIIVCPDGIDNKDYLEVHESTINWHASQRGVQPQDIIDVWKGGVKEKDAWLSFCSYIGEYATSKKWDSLPMPGGQNIRGYDLPISERYASKYKKRLPFNKRDVLDLMDITRLWFMFDAEAPKSLSMDTLRAFFGLSSSGAHTARQDVLDTANIMVKFLKLHESISPKINWGKNGKEN